jgi:two-component system phosphate regulon sensor histidine kinase PhoR
MRAALPAAEVARSRTQVRVAIAVSFLVLLVVAASLSAIAARTVSRPLGRLTEEVQRVARGEFSTVEPGGPAEARALAEAVNAMAAELAERIDAIRREGELRDRILGSMDEAVILADATGAIYANPAARALLGVEPGRPLPPQLQEARAAGGAEFAVHHPSYREIRCTTATVGDGMTLLVAQDVTEPRRIDRIRRDFVANASHEMKTPVAGILATAETLQDAIRDDPEAARRFAETLAKEATRLSNLITDLLDLARLDQPAPDAAEPVDVAALARAAVQESRAGAGAKGLTLVGEIDGAIAVRGRAQDLRQLLRNLIDNAMRYTPEGGRVDVTVSSRGGAAVIEVADTGIGIPQKELSRIFERFYRVDRARARDTGGTGLGLAIVRHVAEAHGGTVAATSELGAGSTFTVTLPRA